MNVVHGAAVSPSAFMWCWCHVMVLVTGVKCLMNVEMMPGVLPCHGAGAWCLVDEVPGADVSPGVFMWCWCRVMVLVPGAL